MVLRMRVPTADVYQDVLIKEVIPSKEASNAGTPCVFQQDSAAAHTAKKTTDLLKELHSGGKMSGHLDSVV